MTARGTPPGVLKHITDNARNLLSLQDPFETSHDLGCLVDRQTSGILHREFERAAATLKDMEDPLPKLFEPYRDPKDQ